MPRIVRFSLALGALLISAAALAQPAGGGAGQATPAPSGPATRPVIVQDFQDILDDPDAALGELFQAIQAGIDDFIRENRRVVDSNLEALPDATGATTTRVLAVALGALALIFPTRTKVWAWLFLGAVIGIVVAQLPVGEDIRRTIFTTDLDFLADEPLSTIGMIGLGALAGLIFVSPFFYFGLMLTGALAGVLIALRVIGYDADLAAPAMAIGGFLGFMLMAFAIGRGGLLVPLLIGAALIVFGVGLGAGWILPLMVASGLVTAARSSQGTQRLQRAMLPTLTLAEGKVNLSPSAGKGKKREHLHEILPAMADDRDNPLIKR